MQYEVVAFQPDQLARGEFNQFAKEHRVERTELSNGILFAFYAPNLTDEELEKREIARRLQIAKENLVHQRIHRSFLDVVSFDNPELMKKRTESKDNTDTELANLEAQIKLYSEWGTQSE